jgi:hypothetical protein
LGIEYPAAHDTLIMRNALSTQKIDFLTILFMVTSLKYEVEVFLIILTLEFLPLSKRQQPFHSKGRSAELSLFLN